MNTQNLPSGFGSPSTPTDAFLSTPPGGVQRGSTPPPNESRADALDCPPAPSGARQVFLALPDPNLCLTPLTLSGAVPLGVMLFGHGLSDSSPRSPVRHYNPDNLRGKHFIDHSSDDLRASKKLRIPDPSELPSLPEGQDSLASLSERIKQRP